MLSEVVAGTGGASTAAAAAETSLFCIAAQPEHKPKAQRVETSSREVSRRTLARHTGATFVGLL